MTHARAWRSLLALIFVAAVAALVPSAATATFPGYSYYHCIAKPTNQWCDGQATGTYTGRHSWDYNQASGGAFTVCQRVYNPSTAYELPWATCGGSFTSRNYGNNTCACYDAEIKQTSGSPQNIYGFADA
jgi:hypothetical protein